MFKKLQYVHIQLGTYLSMILMFIAGLSSVNVVLAQDVHTKKYVL